MPDRHYMLDIETLGTRPGCIIASVAIVEFDPHTGKLGDELFLALNTKQQQARQFFLESKVLEWWRKQPEEVRAASFPEDPVDVEVALSAIEGILKRHAEGNAVCVWSHGLTFDVPILSELFFRYGRYLPWHFRNCRDTRTVYAFAGVEIDKPEDAHNPLSDCKAQIRAVVRAYGNQKD